MDKRTGVNICSINLRKYMKIAMIMIAKKKCHIFVASPVLKREIKLTTPWV